MTRGPKFIDTRKAGAPSAAAKYKAGVEARRSGLQQSRAQPGLPSVSEADAAWRANEDGKATPAQIRESLDNLRKAEAAQKTADEPQQEAPSTEELTGTFAELAAVKARADKKAESDAKKFFEDVDKHARENGEETSAEAGFGVDGDEAEGEGLNEETQKALGRMDKLQLNKLLMQIANDPINNEEQQKIADKLAEEDDPLDIGDIISKNVAEQWVPINSKLRVRFRQPSPWEEHEIRRLISEMVEKGLVEEGLSAEVYGLMTTVAALKQINDNLLPSQIKGRGANQSFDAEAFLRKYETIRRMPTALIHSLTTHAWWFDQRVRKLFTMDNLKNG